MLKLNRSVLAFAGAALVVAACAAPTEADSSSAAPSQETATAPAGDDTGGVASTEAELDRSDDAEAAPDYPYRGGRYSAGVHRRRCNPGDAWHCRRGHRGWRWHDASYGHGHDGHRGERCCMRVPDRPHYRPGPHP
jgi:hypothetical protein